MSGTDIPLIPRGTDVPVDPERRAPPFVQDQPDVSRFLPRPQPEASRDLPWQPDRGQIGADAATAAPSFETMGPSGVRVMQRMGADRFQQAWVLRSMMDMGVSYDRLPQPSRDILDEYNRIRVDDARREFDASTYAQQHAIDNPLELGVRGMGEFADRLVSAVPQLLYGLGSLFGKKVPESMNEAIGLDGVQSPRVGFYLAAADLRSQAKAEGRDMSLSEAYDIVQRGEEQRVGQLGWTGNAYLGGARMTGELAALIAAPEGAAAGAIGKATGITGSWAATPIAYMAHAAEEAIGLRKIAAGLGEWSIGKGAAARLSALAGKEMLLPGARFGLWAGLSDYATPDGQLKDGWQRAAQGMVATAAMPLFAGVSAIAERAALALTGESTVLRGAFQEWLGKQAPAIQQDLHGAWAGFAEAGYPGAPKDVLRRIAQGAIQSTIEGIGFSATDLGFWHDAIDALGGDRKARERAINDIVGNALAMATLRLGGGRNALSAREMERVADWQQTRDLTVIPKGEPLPEGAARPADVPRETPAPEQPQGKPYDLDAEVKAAEGWLDTQSDPRVERDLVLHRAVAAARDATDPAVRDAYLRYAGKVYRWKDSLIDGPETAEPAIREKVAEWHQDVLDRRSRVSGRAAEQAANVEAGRQPDQKAPRSLTAMDLRRIAEGMGGRVSESRGKVAQEGEKPVRPLAEKPAEISQQEAAIEDKRAVHEAGIESAMDFMARRDAEIATARLALEGIGGPTAEEGVRLVYDKKNPARLVTYQDGKYLQRNLYGDRSWKPMSDKEAARLRGKAQPDEPIVGQLAVVNQVAKRLFELGDQLGPDEVRAVTAAARLAATVDRQKDPGINAALTMAEQVLPQNWNPHQVSAWAQMALRGYSPEAQTAILGEFVRQAEAQRGQTPEPTPGPSGSERAPSPQQQTEKQGGLAYQPVGETPASEHQSADVGMLSEKDLRDLASELGMPSEGISGEQLAANLREVGIEVEHGSMNPESGQVSPLVAGVAAAAAGVTVIPGASATVFGPKTIAGALLLSSVPTLHRFWAKKNAESLEHVGPPEKAKPVIEAFQRQRDRAAENMRVVADKVQDLKDKTGENFWTKVGRKYREATRKLQRVAWDSTGKNSAGDDLVNLYLDGHAEIPKDLDPKVKGILDDMMSLRNAVGDMVAERGVWRRNEKTGAYYRAKFNPENFKLPRVYALEGNDVLSRPGSKAWLVLRDGIAKRNNFTIEEADQKLRIISQMDPYRRGNFEVERTIPWMPSYIRVDGNEIQILETRPFEWASRYSKLSADRLAHIETWGQESMGKAGETQEGLLQSVGMKTSLVNPTEEQIRNRKALEEFIAASPDQHKATDTVVAVMRAHHGLAIDKPLNIKWIIDTVPGSASQKARHFIHAITTAWKSVHLATAFQQNLWEPAALAQTLVGAERMLRHQFLAWKDRMFAPGAFNSALRTLARDIGGAANEPSVRMGGLSAEARPGHRASDVGHLLDLAAAPMQIVNTVNDVALGRAGMEIVETMKQQKPEENRSFDHLLRFLKFTDAERQTFIDGKATPEMDRAFVRRLRTDIYFVREKADQGLLQQSRIFKFIQPYMGWSSGNMRAWGRIASTTAEIWKDPNATWGQKAGAAAKFMRFVASKLGTHAASMVGYQMLFYGSAFWQAFQGNDQSQTAKTFFQKLGIYALAQEIAGPLVGSIISGILKENQGSSLTQAVTAAVRTIPLVDIATQGGMALSRTGPYEKARGGLFGLTDVGFIALKQEIPGLRAIDQVAHDPGMAAAIRRYYEIFPTPGGGPDADQHDAFRGAMARIVESVQRSSRNLRNLDPKAILQDAREAMLAKPTDAKTLLKWEKASPDERAAYGKKHVLSSLKSRDLWGSMSEQQQEQYIKLAGKENARALAAYSAMLGEIRDFVDRSF